MEGEDDTDARFQVVEPNLSEEEDRIHTESIALIREAVQAGKKWERIVKELKVADAALKQIILDDFLKVTIAEHHFGQGEGLKAIAKRMHLPMAALVAAKESMIDEVRAASEEVYRRSKQGG
ncbi:MAG: hypothetical protein HQL57_06630 [Magnetococcales bacterium]|nr:hypothetical protein [Magnetococcales bacterium]MBF0156846.1 hypothetical protein [Magnetococcales bacterium]